MKDPIPASLVKVESGHTADTPPLRFTPTATSQEEALGNPDETRNAIVVYLKDNEQQAYAEMVKNFGGLPSPDPQRGFCFHIGTARALCIDLLYHLAGVGEPVATKIVERLDDIRQELEIEKSAQDEGE